MKILKTLPAIAGILFAQSVSVRGPELTMSGSTISHARTDGNIHVPRSFGVPDGYQLTTHGGSGDAYWAAPGGAFVDSARAARKADTAIYATVAGRADSARVSGLSDSAKALVRYTRITATHDTADSVRAYARARISDSLTTNVRGWINSATARSIVSDSMRVERTFDTVTARAVTHDTSLALRTLISAREPALGNPSQSGQVVSSTTGGVRSWISVVDSARTRAIIHDTSAAIRAATQPLDADLTAVAALTGTGYAKRTATTPTWTTVSSIPDADIASAATWNAKVGGSGATNKLPKWTGAATLGNSLLSDDGLTVLAAAATDSPLIKATTTSASANSAGVKGVATVGNGVQGTATGSAGVGVLGTASGVGGSGVFAIGSGTADALYALAGGSGRAGYFSGPVQITGTATLASSLTGILKAASGVVAVATAPDFPTLNQNTTGSAAKWTTARTLTIGSTGKSLDGSANVSWSLAEIGAQAAGSYQPLEDQRLSTANGPTFAQLTTPLWLTASTAAGRAPSSGAFFSGSPVSTGDLALRANSGAIWLGIGTGASAASLKITGSDVSIASLAGTGTRVVTTDLNGKLGAASWTYDGPWLSLANGGTVTGYTAFNNDIGVGKLRTGTTNDFLVSFGDVMIETGDGTAWATPRMRFRNTGAQALRIDGGMQLNGATDFTAGIGAGVSKQMPSRLYSASSSLPILGLNEWCWVIHDSNPGGPNYWTVPTGMTVQYYAGGTTITTVTAGNTVTVAANQKAWTLYGPTYSGSTVMTLRM